MKEFESSDALSLIFLKIFPFSPKISSSHFNLGPCLWLSLPCSREWPHSQDTWVCSHGDLLMTNSARDPNSQLFIKNTLLFTRQKDSTAINIWEMQENKPWVLSYQSNLAGWKHLGFQQPQLFISKNKLLLFFCMEKKGSAWERLGKKFTRDICSFLNMIFNTLFVCFAVTIFNSLLELLPSKSIKWWQPTMHVRMELSYVSIN